MFDKVMVHWGQRTLREYERCCYSDALPTAAYCSLRNEESEESVKKRLIFVSMQHSEPDVKTQRRESTR